MKFFFFCTASADLLFNLSLVSRCVIDLTSSMSIEFCQLLAFTSHLAELLSACFTVHFTVQRFIAVRFPLSVFMEKKIHLLHYCLIILFLLSSGMYCFTLVKSNSYEDCREDLSLNWFLSDAISSFVIPFLIIAILNLLIICHLRATSRKNEEISPIHRRQQEFTALMELKKFSFSNDSISHSRFSDNNSMLNLRVRSLLQTLIIYGLFLSSIQTPIYRFPSLSEPHEQQFLSVGSSTRRRSSSIRSTQRSHAQSHRVTRMLILVSTCFLIFNAPSHVCSISLELYTLRKSIAVTARTNHTHSIALNDTTLHHNSTHFSPMPIRMTSTSRRKIFLLQLSYIMLIISKHVAYLSYSINFFLYSFCGMKFRGELMRYLTRYRREKTRTVVRGDSV